jgi:hypothetical protein
LIKGIDIQVKKQKRKKQTWGWEKFSN